MATQAQPRRTETALPDLTYREFLDLVHTAAGRFSYLCLGYLGTCDPPIYAGRNWPFGWRHAK